MSSCPKRKSQKQSHEALVAHIAKEMARPRKTASVLREELKRETDHRDGDNANYDGESLYLPFLV